jgi:hypothetical protein
MPWIIASHWLSSAARDEEELVGQEMPATIAAVDETARWPPAPMPRICAQAPPGHYPQATRIFIASSRHPCPRLGRSRRTARGLCLMSVHLIGVHLMGVYLISMYLTGASHRHVSHGHALYRRVLHGHVP